MKRDMRYRHLGAVAAAGLMVLALLPPAVHAEVGRTGEEPAEVEGTGEEPWYQQATADISQAKDLFRKAVDAHRQLSREAARDLYEQALALWNNPDIQWNLALVLEDLGQYLRAYNLLVEALRWREALGAERLSVIRSRMQKLETQHLGRIEASSDVPGAEITFDCQPWFHGPGRQSRPVEVGEHYIAARKLGFFQVTRRVSTKAGYAALVRLPMDADRRLETRRWSAWTP